MRALLLTALLFFGGLAERPRWQGTWTPPGPGYEPDVQYWVDAATGSDSNPGTQAQPFATLEKARQVVAGQDLVAGRTVPGAVIHVSAGTYYLSSTLALTSADNGVDASHPVEWRAEGGTVVVSGAQPIADGLWQLITATDDEYYRIPAAARGSAYKLDLTAAGISGGTMGAGYGGAENRLMLIDDGQLAPYSRWPSAGSDPNQLWNGAEREAAGWVQMEARLSGGITWGEATTVRLNTSTPTGWNVTDQDILAYGNWAYEWAIESNYITGISTDGGTGKAIIHFNKENSYDVYAESLGSKKIAFLNALEGLSAGTCVYRKKISSPALIYWPAAGGAPTGVSATSLQTLVSLQGVSFVKFTGFAFEGARRELIDADNVADITFADCHFRNAPNVGLKVDGAYRLVIDGGSSTRLGRRWGHLVAGDKVNFVDGQCQIVNHTFEDISFLYQDTTVAALNLDAAPSSGGASDSCGVFMDNLTFRRMRGAALGMTGAKLVLEDSLFEDCNMIDGDGGTINGGFRFTSRYNVIRRCTLRNNYRHPLNHQSVGALYAIYCDSQAGWTIEDNVFENCDHAILIAGGYGVVARRNKATNCHNGHHQSPYVFGSRVSYTNVNAAVEPDLAACNLESGNWAADTPPSPFPSTADLIACRAGGAQNSVIRYHRNIVFVDNMSTTGTYFATVPDVGTGNVRQGMVDGFTVGIDRSQLNYPVGSTGTPVDGGGTAAISTMDKP